ncbi:MAG: hypothetical protein Q8Q08_00020 [Candidatus Omnitrophota bacterium]|nr:hypothetical protein [Candidatus Omnitrophota bacterium]
MKVKRYEMGGVASVVEETVIAMVETLVSLGAEDHVGGLGVGGSASALVVPCPSPLSEVASPSAFWALTLKPYVITAPRPFTTKPSHVASDFQDSLVLVEILLLVPAIQKLLKFVSVEDACTANWVVGFDAGFPFASLLVIVRVEVPAEPIVGVPGMAAEVYVSETVDEEPAVELPSLDCTA